MSKTVFEKYDGSILTADLSNIEDTIDQMELNDFNYLLTKINRHNGAFGDVCNVYAHSAYMAEKAYMVCNMANDSVLYNQVRNACLVHDFAEVFTGDIPKPSKYQFCCSHSDLSEHNNIAEFEALVSGITLKKYFEQKEYPAELVSELDRLAVYAEALVFGGMKLFKAYLEADGVDITSPEEALFLLNIIEYSQGLKEFYGCCSNF